MASTRQSSPGARHRALESADEFVKAVDGTDEIELTVTGRVSGREITNPVWFVREDKKLHLLPVRGSDSDWYKNVLKRPTIRLTARRKTRPARAVPITDPAKVAEVVAEFRSKYGAGEVKKYYSKLDVAVDVRLARASFGA